MKAVSVVGISKGFRLIIFMSISPQLQSDVQYTYRVGTARKSACISVLTAGEYILLLFYCYGEILVSRSWKRVLFVNVAITTS